MFTGIVKLRGKVALNKGRLLRIQAPGLRPKLLHPIQHHLVVHQLPQDRHGLLLRQALDSLQVVVRWKL